MVVDINLDPDYTGSVNRPSDISETVCRLYRDSQETQRQSRNSPETVQRQTRDSSETVKEHPKLDNLSIFKGKGIQSFHQRDDDRTNEQTTKRL